MKRKILIVEDNVALSQLQRDWLERCGYAVTTAMDEPAAKRVLKAENIALILSDVRLPQGNGIELLHKRKKVRRLFRHKLCGRIHDIEFPQESRLSQRNDQQLSKLCIVLNRCAGKDGDAHPQCDAADQRSGIIHHSDHIQIVQRKPPVFQIIERFLFCPRSILPQEKRFF